MLLPFLINYLVRTYAWVALLSDEGLLSRVAGEPLGVINTPVAVIGGLVYGYLGFMILPIYASLERMDPALIEAGKDLYGIAAPDLLARHLAADAAGRAGRARCSCSCPRSATSSARSCSAGPTRT